MSDLNAKREQLLELSHELGSPSHDWSILGEGNTSTHADGETFFVKASGSSLGTLRPDQVSQVRFAPILDALENGKAYTDAEIASLLLGSCLGENPKMPSTETLFHAFLLSLPGIEFVGHTHVTTVNGLLCSQRGWDAISSGGRMFPDEIVVCGLEPCCVPYIDPGMELGRGVRKAVLEHQQRFGELPKTIYIRNHGFVAIGGSAKEVISIHMMADKAARIMLGAMACGGPVFLTEDNKQRIRTRPDEHLRQRELGLKEDKPA